MDLTLVTASTADPVSVAEAKDHLYLTSNDYDASLRRKIKAATEYCQSHIGGHRQFSQATYDGVMDGFPGGEGRLTLPLPPLQSITSITYITSTGGTTTVSSTAYTALTPTNDPGYVEPAYGKTWPSTREVPNAVTVRFVAGYSTVPESIKEAVLLKLEHLWEPGRVKESEIDAAIDGLLSGNEYGHYA